jgi:hypothetical protein
MECSLFWFVPICGRYVFSRRSSLRIRLVLGGLRCGCAFSVLQIRGGSDGADFRVAAIEDCCRARAMAVPMAGVVEFSNDVFFGGCPDGTDPVHGGFNVGAARFIF